MSYGLKSYDDDGYINLHSDYSSLVYAGEMTESASPVRPVYAGDYAISIQDFEKNNYYDQGWVMQFKINLNVDYLVPFYRPNYNGQEIGILDVVNEGSTWVVNLVYGGASTNKPRLFAFAPLTELPSSLVTVNNYGAVVYDSSGDLVFTDAMQPLRVDDVLTVQHPSSIRSAARGSCANSNNCHVNFTSDQATTYTGSTLNSASKIYHVVPSAYGGLAFQNSGSFTRSCGFLGFGDRPYQWGYKSWASFRGALSHPYGTAGHTTGWLGDFSGGVHQQVSGSCGYSGILGALIGIAAVVFTGGIGLAVLAGALGGFVLGELTVASAPSLRAYQQDAVFDQNKSYQLLMTDASYYGVSTSSSTQGTGPTDLTYYYSLVDPFWWWADVDIVATDGTTVNQYAELYWNDTEITDWDNSVFADFDGYSYTSGSDTYYKGANTFLVEERRIVDTAGNPFGIVYYSFKDIARG
mgnify:CR=1 FL=1|tara:strand:- start:233 stop:1630 length:1398 start_codon:yes stop_codon:yes gene_type:complete